MRESYLPNKLTNMFTAKFWQNTTMALMCLSFLAANARMGAAYNLWSQSPQSLMMFLGLGVGMKMVKDSVDKTMTMKYNNGSSKVDDPDRGM